MTKSGLEIILDKQRQLTHGDPTSRETYISLGIFTEACVIGLRSHGYEVSEPKLSAESVDLSVKPAKSPEKLDEDVAAILRRFTDRTIFKSANVSPQMIDKLNASWQSYGVKVHATSDQAVIEHTAKLTRQALLLAFSNPGFRKELTKFFVTKTSTPYGIPLSTMGTGRLKARLVRRLIASGLNRKQEAQTEFRRWRSASLLVFILAEGDSKSYWLESGRAYMRACIEIEKLGLNQATSAAIVEAADFHEDIEKMLGTDMRIQCVVRAGRGQKKRRPSGRLTPQELLVT